MSLDRFALFRPINVDTSSDSFGISTTSGGAATAYTLSVGTYGHLPGMLAEFVDKADATVTDLSVSIISDGSADQGKVKFSSATFNFRIDWTDGDLRDRLGFTGSSTTSTGSGPYTATATYRPQYSWFSDYGTADLGTWKSDPDEIFRGRIAQNGRLAGIQTGDVLRRWKLDVVHNEARWTLESRDEVSVAQGATSDAVRSLEYLVRQSKVVTPDTTADLNPRGCYLYYTATNIEISSDYTTREGIYKDAAIANKFKFVSIEKMSEPRPSVPRSTRYWNVTLDLVTADPPTWDAP